MATIDNTMGHVLDRFGLCLIDKERENQIFSPLGAFLALGPLVYFKDYPRRKLFKWFGLDPATSDDQFADFLKSLGRGFEEGEGNRMFWAVAYPRRIPMPVNDLPYLRDRIGVCLVETTFPEPGTALINKAISEATNGKIQKAVSGASERSLFLVNAIYLHRYWKECLSERRADKWLLPDSSSYLDFAGAEGRFKYAETKAYIYVAIPYARKYHGCEMEIYLTRDRAKLPIGLTVDDMESLRKKAKPRKMSLFIPLWEEEAKLDLSEILAVKAGIMYNPPTHDAMEIGQLVKIAVDEDGTEAAAATYVCCVDSLPEVRRWPNLFVVNRPFIYTIRTGSVTEFMGYLYNPGNPPVSPQGSDEEPKSSYSSDY